MKFIAVIWGSLMAAAVFAGCSSGNTRAENVLKRDPANAHALSSFSCTHWLEFDSTKETYVPMPSANCAAINCTKTSVSVKASGPKQYHIHVNDEVYNATFAPPVGFDFDGYIYDTGKGYQFWISAEGNEYRVTFIKNNKAVGVGCDPTHQ